MSSNFDFLQSDFPVLANFGALAEKYYKSDPNSCLMKLGMIGETIVNLMFDYDDLTPPEDNNAAVKINMLTNEEFLTKDLADLLHTLRKKRNKAVHENYSSESDCQALLPIAHSLCEWFMQTYGDYSYEHHEFVMPSEETEATAVTATEEEKKHEEENEAALIKEAAEKAVAAPAVSKSERKKKAFRMANLRKMTEAETRMLIDEQLREVGWEADTNELRYSKGTRPVPGHNMAIAEWPTDSTVGTNGYADYALFIGNRMVGIIEAKAQHHDISSVIDFQGKDYPRNIKEDDEPYCFGPWGDYKVPFTFATNGRPYIEQFKQKSGIWFLDLRKPDNVAEPLRGWINPIGMADLLEKDIEAGNKALLSMNYDFLRDKDGLALRDYQVKAIMAAEQAVLDGKKTALLAMATGTGKTRTVLGMIYRFLKTDRFKRILFLVDRTSLGEQASDVFKEVKLEDLMTLDDIYNIKGLSDKEIDKETRIQIATVQSMVKRILYNEGETMPGVTDYDLIICDEAHRGYILDKEMGDQDVVFRDQRDFQSKYRSVIDYFDAVKIGLTATPALQTTEIFGEPVFVYTYREAVIEGYLVDHDAPHHLETKLSTQGIHYKKGDNIVIYNPVTGEILNSQLLEDELDFDVDKFNRQVVTEEFNRAVLTEIAKDIDPDSPEENGKTLIYAVNDQHADMVVSILKEIYAGFGVDNDAVMKITGSIAGGNPKKVQEAIKRFKNERFPSIVVTVDLLTTGIDVPEITTLVFMRRVKSRILFEQMLGRATRLCPSIHKTHFEIYDPVGVYESLEDVNTMKPVVTDPSTTFTELVEGLNEMNDDEHLQNQINLIIAKLQRKKRNLSQDSLEQFKSMAEGKDPTEFINDLKNRDTASAKKHLLDHMDLFSYLQYTKAGNRGVVISKEEDELLVHTRGYGNGEKPEDYINAFSEYVRTHINEVAALKILCTRPSDLTRQSLKELRLQLDREGFTTQQLNTAISELSNEEITADIISLIRKYAIGSALLSHEERIKKAVEKLNKAHRFSLQQKNWITRIEKYLLEESVLNVSVFDEDSRFSSSGGFQKINKVFSDNLISIVSELNGYLYDDGGKMA